MSTQRRAGAWLVFVAIPFCSPNAYAQMSVATAPLNRFTETYDPASATSTWARGAVTAIPLTGAWAPSVDSETLVDQGLHRPEGPVGWLEVVACTGATQAAVTTAAGLFQDIGVGFTVRTNEACNRNKPDFMFVWDRLDISKPGRVDTSHWAIRAGSDTDEVYAQVLEELPPKDAQGQPIGLPPIAATSIHCVLIEPDPQNPNALNGGADFTECSWDIVFNDANYDGFLVNVMPSEFANHPQGGVPWGDTSTAKYGVGIAAHELMHVLGAAHAPSTSFDLHTMMYEQDDETPAYEVHYGLEVNADLYHPNGPQPGERVIPMSDQVFLETHYSPFEPPPRTVVVPWERYEFQDGQGSWRMAWRGWGYQLLDWGAATTLSGPGDNDYHQIHTASCHNECLDPADDVNVEALVNSLPEVASNHASDETYYHLQLKDRVTLANGCTSTLLGTMTIARSPNGMLNDPFFHPPAFNDNGDHVSCWKEQEGPWVDIAGFNLVGAESICGTGTNHFVVAFTTPTTTLQGTNVALTLFAPWEATLSSPTSLSCGE